MRVKLISMTLIALLSFAAYVFAEEGHGQHGYEGPMMWQIKEEASSAVEVGNKICPISGEKVSMTGVPVQYEYKGRIYNFYSTECVETFKKRAR